MKVPRDQMHVIAERYYEIPSEHRKCLRCGAPLPEAIRDAWSHIGGIPLDKEYAWLYVECTECHYQNALYKLFHYAGVQV